MLGKGLLLINLGSPMSPEKRSVRRYLREFLNDPYVIDLPTPVRLALVHGLIVPLRVRKSSQAYKKIWTKDGSPLVHFTRQFSEAVKIRLAPEWDVRWGMRYGAPRLSDQIAGWDVSELYIVPLYPQYAESSTRTAVECAMRAVRNNKNIKRVHILSDFFAQTEFIDAQALQIERALNAFNPDRLLLSFHGLPEHHLQKLHPACCFKSSHCCDSVSDVNRYCYRAQAFATVEALRAKLPLAPEKIAIGFQSRLGRRPWIKPYTDHIIHQFRSEGVKRVLVSCPSFVADCLETLEEIELRLREQFLAAGGEDLRLVPALNAEAHWSEKFCQMVNRESLKWD